MKQDLRLDANYLDNPKIKRLRASLGDTGIVSHIALLCYVRRIFPEGKLHDMTSIEIEDAARWQGESGLFSATLERLRLLHQNGDGYEIHDWYEHNRFAATEPIRREIARNAVNKRWEKRGVNTSRNTSSNTNSNTPSPIPIPIPIPTSLKRSISLVEFFVQKILAWKPDFKIPSQAAKKSWAKEFDLMLRKDDRSEERIKAVIEFATADDFWQSNILSAKKLRLQFDTLEARKRRKDDLI
jgi:hypothetical protein